MYRDLGTGPHQILADIITLYSNQVKEVCNRAVAYLLALARSQILAFWLKTDMDSVNKQICLAPDVKMVMPKNFTNDLKINLGT